MSRIWTIGLVLGFVLGFGLPGAADAGAGSRRCLDCGPTSTTRVIRTIHPLLNVTRYHDLAVYHRVTRLHYVVDVTRIQPIIHVNDVTRIRHFTIVRDAYAYPPQVVAPDPDALRIPAYAPGCGCVD